MKKSKKMLKKYIDAFLYCAFLVVCIFLIVYGNIYIKMIPIALICGILSYIFGDRKYMSVVFSLIGFLVLYQIKYPSNLEDNVIKSLAFSVIILFGQISGKSIYVLYSTRKRREKKYRKLRKNNALFLILFVILGIAINSLFNGDYITYAISRNNLKHYFISNYNSGSRFKIINSKYDIGKYTFYTIDTVNSNENGMFCVYVKDIDQVRDMYKKAVIDKKAKNIEEELASFNNFGIDVYVTNSNDLALTLELHSTVEDITYDSIENYARNVANYIESIKEVDGFNDIEQIEIVLKSRNNENQNMATFIYMDSYLKMLEDNNIEPYKYIINALNTEFFN